MLLVAREYIKKQPVIRWDSRLYLTGYSEGGFATMLLYKKLQDKVPTEFNLRGVSCGAGAYDKTSFMKALLTQPSAGVALDLIITTPLPILYPSLSACGKRPTGIESSTDILSMLYYLGICRVIQ